MKVKNKFLVLLIVCLLVPIISTSIAFFVGFQKQTNEIIEENVQSIANLQARNMGRFFNQRIVQVEALVLVPQIKEILIQSNQSQVNSQRNYHEIEDIFKATVEELDFVSMVGLVNKRDELILANEEEITGRHVLKKEKQIFKDGYEPTFSAVKTGTTGILNGQQYFNLSYPILENGVYQGYVFMAINNSYFDLLVEQSQFLKSGLVAIVDNEGQLISAGNKSTSDNGNQLNKYFAKNSQEYLDHLEVKAKDSFRLEVNNVQKQGYYIQLPKVGWSVISIVDQSVFSEHLRPLLHTLLVVMMFVMIVMIIVFLFVFKRLSQPLDSLVQSISKIQSGDYTTRVPFTYNDEYGEIAKAFNGLMDTIVSNTEEIKKSKLMLEAIISNIPGGVQQCTIKNGCKFFYASDGYLELIGYTQIELEEVFQNDFYKTIDERDRIRVQEEIQQQLETGNTLELEYRLKCKNGDVKWVRDKARKVLDDKQIPWLYCVVIDITTSKLAQEELKQSEERHRIIMEQTESIIFEWNIQEDSLQMSSVWEKKFGYPPITQQICKTLPKSDLIHPNDLDVFIQLLKRAAKGIEVNEADIRIKKIPNTYLWCKVKATTQYNENGIPQKAIGVILDIHHDKEKAEKLLFKSQRDTLTKLYNKGTTNALISEYLKKEGKNEKHALLMLDIDNFKAVNDNLGHLYGDEVLKEVAAKIQKHFRESDIVGRVGGDEFIVLMKEVGSRENVLEKVNMLLNEFRQTYSGKNKDYKISGSIGYLYYPEHGTDLIELLDKVDKVLYMAKKKGKDCSCLYQEIKDETLE